jgi:CheY-like chemotaxis protein
MRSRTRILLVEDNAADVRLTTEAMREAGSQATPTIARDGVEALDRLTQPHAELPDLILLDLNLPRRDGREVLRDIKSNPMLAHIPVVIFTTSSAEADVRACYALGANAYVIKPVDLSQFLMVIAAIQEFWLSTARLPASPDRRDP